MKKEPKAKPDKDPKGQPPRRLKRRRKPDKDPDPPAPAKKARGPYLRNPLSVRQGLSKWMGECYRGEITESLLRTLAYASQVLLKAMVEGDYELRLQRLEAALDLKREREGNGTWPEPGTTDSKPLVTH